MDLSQEVKQQLEQIAENTLVKFETVAKAAQEALSDEPGIGAESLASINTMTSPLTVQRLGKIRKDIIESNQTLTREPAIARVLVADNAGKQRVYFICRATPISGVSDLASVRAPVGRLASKPIGSDFTLPDGTIVVILEQALLRPIEIDDVWDSRNTIVKSDHFGPVTIESLRALLEKAPGVELEEELLQRLLDEVTQSANLIDGIRRSVITKMVLRDQPILDQYQDEIFRLPLDRRLLILGPPGTGKTTTLIRRLGQKLDLTFLNEDEISIVDGVNTSNSAQHAQSWLMFTPTDLLKQYLKEAFAREGVPASDLKIRTWFDYRRELARNTFDILRTATGRGSFILKDSVENLAADALDKPISWFSDFDDWQRSVYLKELHKSAQELCNNKASDLAELGQRLLVNVERADGSSIVDSFSAFAFDVEKIQDLLAHMKEETDKRIRRVLNLQMNRDNEFVQKLVAFLDGLKQTQDDENEDYEDQDEDETNTPRTGRAAAVTAYMRAVRAQARAHASKRKIGENSRNGRLIVWLGERALGESDLEEVGASLLIQTSVRRFANPVKRYIDSIPARYRRFRRQRQKEEQWYCKDSFNPTDLHPLELDVLLLAILKGMDELLSKPVILRDINEPVWSSLKPMLGLYKNQILADEVTDFSPIQIACMATLSEPRIRSFFACGDFNQRLTTWGSRSLDEMKWVFPSIEVKEITVTYRQTRQLNELARAIIEAEGGTDQGAILPANVDSEGVDPALLEGALELTVVIDWLAQRIREIERFVEQMPSIAVFVESETEVQSIADALNTALTADNTQVVACTRGQSIGQDNDVRVFDIQHIKGLEFEAVFFIGVDRLAILHPQLFTKYLYVGTTRAATYLGITCHDTLPPVISNLKRLFVSDWDTP